MARLSALDPGTALLARHAQHVVLIHFPIALLIAGVALDLAGAWTKRRALADAAYVNLMSAAFSTLPAFATGLLAWRLQLQGQKLKGVLLWHLIFACASTALIWLVGLMHWRTRRMGEALSRRRFALEMLTAAIVALTGHLGGFLSGVNGPG
jgi:uncharacterized membrane protein